MAVMRKPHIKGNKAVISLTIDPDQATALGEYADAQRTSVAAIARQAIDLFLRINTPVAPMPSAHVSSTLEATDDRAA